LRTTKDVSSDFSTRESAYQLAYELYKISPDILLSVIPLIEDQLKVILFFLFPFFKKRKTK